jgi:hypothetical protein
MGRPAQPGRRLWALHRGVVGPGSASASGIAAGCGAKAPRHRANVPGRGPGRLVSAVTSRGRRHTPLRRQDRLRRRPSSSRIMHITLDAICSQELSSNRDDKFDGLSIVSRARRSMEPIRAFTPVFAGYGGMMRRRTGTVTDTAKSRSLQTAFATVPEQRRTRRRAPRCTASGTRCGVIRVLSPHTQPLSSRSTSCQITSMPGPLSLRQGIAAKFCPP